MITNRDIEGRIDEAVRVQASIREKADVLRRMAGIWLDALKDGRKVIFFGNGGSAADAQHLVCELAGRFYMDRRPLPALALTVNTSTLTAIGNDYGFDDVFSRQLAGVGRAGDVAVGISTSGNSANVVRALETARLLGLVTISLTGRSGGLCRDLCDLWLGIESDDTPRVQEGHILAGHIVCALVERELFGDGA